MLNTEDCWNHANLESN